ncbi:hypothetical protein BJX70DRAFT_395643 [Aspergillus crustosus]
MARIQNLASPFPQRRFRNRLARRGGVYRIKKEIYDEIRVVIKERLTKVLEQVVLVLGSSQTPTHDRKVWQTAFHSVSVV